MTNLLTRQPAKSKLKLKLLSKTYEFFSLDIGCIKILDKFRFFSALSLHVVAKTLGNNQQEGIYPYDYID